MRSLVAGKRDIEMQVFVRGSVSGAGRNRRMIIQPYWNVLTTNGRLEGEQFPGVVNKLVRKPFILKRKECYKRGREKPQGNGGEGKVEEVDCQKRDRASVKGVQVNQATGEDTQDGGGGGKDISERRNE